jgi:hypothetical protein
LIVGIASPIAPSSAFSPIIGMTTRWMNSLVIMLG